MTDRVFRRKTDNGHRSIIKASVYGNNIGITIGIPALTRTSAIVYRNIITTLDAEDAERFSNWLLEKSNRIKKVK